MVDRFHEITFENTMSQNFVEHVKYHHEVMEKELPIKKNLKLFSEIHVFS